MPPGADTLALALLAVVGFGIGTVVFLAAAVVSLILAFLPLWIVVSLCCSDPTPHTKE